MIESRSRLVVIEIKQLDLTNIWEVKLIGFGDGFYLRV